MAWVREDSRLRTVGSRCGAVVGRTAHKRIADDGSTQGGATANNKVFSIFIRASVAAASVMLFLYAGSSRAQNSSSKYTFVLGSGFLCEADEPTNCPVVAKSANGDSYEISGAGTFDPQNKSVRAAGTYNHKSTNGRVVETGVWIASELISFDFYGIAPAAISQKGTAFGVSQMGPKRSVMRSAALPAGGLAVFRVRLIAVSGTIRTAVLRANCALGDVPRERSVEGIRITLDRNNSEYSEEVSGRLMFLALSRENDTPAELREQKPPEPSQQPRK